jgi:oligopeptide/dipeptide ABC transporter ATP-binding protein
MSAPVVEIRDLRTYFPVPQNIVSRLRNGPATVRAVDGVSLTVHRGETVGLVGESGCGKSTLGRSILGLVQPTSGDIRIDGTDVVHASGPELRQVRRRAQIIFQDPASSLNPRMTVGQTLVEPLEIYKLRSRTERRDRVAELLRLVGLPVGAADRFPHQFSGGQRQRVGIAAALALEPAVIVADEPTSALDVSVQAQILNLLQGLQQSLGVAYLFISHNLDVVRHLSDRIAVMYLGKIVESSQTEDLFQNPLHPYTRALLSAIPDPDPDAHVEPVLLSGEIPSPLNPPAACRFHPRCPIARARCATVEPDLLGDQDDHLVACHAVAWARAQARPGEKVPDLSGWDDAQPNQPEGWETA